MRVDYYHTGGQGTEIVSLDHPDLPESELAAVIEHVRDAMAVD